MQKKLMRRPARSVGFIVRSNRCCVFLDLRTTCVFTIPILCFTFVSTHAFITTHAVYGRIGDGHVLELSVGAPTGKDGEPLKNP